MYTNGQIIINATSEDLIRDGHSIVESFEEVQEKSWYKLNEDQKAFKQANPDSDITEVIACQLGKYTFDKAKERLIERIRQADKDAEILYVNDISMWIDKSTRTSLRGVTIPAYKALGRTEKTMWSNNNPPIPFHVPLDLLDNLMMQLDVYSSDVYDRTAKLIAEVDTLTTSEQVDNFEISGYPEPLHFTLNEHKDDI